MANERTWTDSQRDAFTARGGMVLVSAAAGSGKTSVLVERALRLLCDGSKPVPADRLLVVTFTKAAAAEMRGRLEASLEELMRQRPDDRQLRRQSLLLPQAHIGTVDSFCAELLREYFHKLDLPPAFSILSEKQEDEMKAGCMEEALDSAFQAGTIRELADAFSGERDDSQLTKIALRLYTFMRSHPFPEKWLKEKAELYRRGDPAQWEGELLASARDTARHFERLCRHAAAQTQGEDAISKAFHGPFLDDAAYLAELAGLCEDGDWDGAVTALNSHTWERLGRVPAGEKDASYARLASLREDMKEAMKKLKKPLFGSREQCREELRRAAPVVESLAALVLDFSARYAQAKREREALDYGDLEHFALELLMDSDKKITELTGELRGRFDEIMIDECQDINEVQDLIFRTLSRSEENLFLVGDVKQSIYGFRQAMPHLFTRSREACAPYDRQRPAFPACVVLDRNFRSRREVTRAVNFVFSALMSKQAGDVDYAGEERLVCAANYEEKEGCDTQLVCLEKPEHTPVEVLEARWIAGRVRRLMEEGFTVQGRPVEYGDICILLRYANRYAAGYAKELNRLGIPARAAGGSDFFQAAEIGVMLSLLRAVDNPDQDIPLLALLMSPIYGFTAGDCASLRLNREREHMPFYLSLCRAAEEEGPLRERCAKVLADLRQLRDLAATMPSDSFITLVYEKTAYPELVLAMEGGENRVRNLRLLRSYAADYESTGYHGISGFVRFLDRLKRGGSDLQAAEAAPGSQNAVTIMSVHKSKGLEFPVCIVAGCGREFNQLDSRSDVVLDPELGLGLRLKDRATLSSTTTSAREAILLRNRRASASEELRILYVAMTRPREKMILLGSKEGAEKSLSGLGMAAVGGKISPYAVRGAKSPMDWLLMAALLHPDGESLRQLAGLDNSEVLPGEEPFHWDISLEEPEIEDEAAPEERLPQEQEEEPAAPPDEALLARLREQIAWRYPHEAAMDIPVKVAASRLAEEQGADRELSLSRPAWLGAKGMTPAQRGTAVHAFLEHADYARAAREGVGKELERLVELAFLSPEEAEAVDVWQVKRFLESGLCRRLLASPRMERELRFTATIDAALLRPDAPDDEEVILQGAVDCLFFEDGKLHIVDFKTDRVQDTRELWERYAPQIQLYARAMEQVFGAQIGELILYSTRLGKADSRPAR